MTPFQSQLGQDKWIAELFKGKRNGYFVDVGAFDGYELSNTYYLEKELGWSGVCVEPLSDAFVTLRRVRSCICENVCIAEAPGQVYLTQAGTGSAIVNGPKENTIQVQAITLEMLFVKHHVPPVIDYFSIDIEGKELSVMQSFPFNKYHFLALTVEHNSYMGPEFVRRRGLMHTLLESNGYKFVRQVDCDDWYTKIP